jgi:hypothetical protein
MKIVNELELRIMFAVVFVISFVGAAQAQATRTFVSGVGDDANPCSRTAPCRTLSGAISKTAAGGEINSIDAVTLGAVTITKSITINVEPFLGGILVSSQNGITITDSGANNIVVTLRGLDFEGLSGTGNPPGINGVRILSAKSVSIENCSIRNFGNNGVSDERTGGGNLFITNTVIKNNALSNVAITGASTPAVSASLDNVKLIGSNGNGLLVSSSNTAVIRGSVVFGNLNHGILTNDANTDVSVDDCILSSNGTAIRTQNGSPIVRISGNTITKNGTSLRPGSNGGQIISYGNNNISGNNIELAPTSTIARQ